jgi:hypothetical protein
MNKVEEMAVQLVHLGKEIILLLEDHAPVEKILSLMDKRDEIINDIKNSGELLTNVHLMQQLQSLRMEEDAALKPYRSEFQDVRQALINLRHAEIYQNGD